jgi:hypothetical protein
MPTTNIRAAIAASDNDTILTIAMRFVRIGKEKLAKDARARWTTSTPWP